MKNILLTISYDGSDFHGWQRQPDERTVQGLLEEKLFEILGSETRLEGTSRTDAGVHALGQCATLRGDFGIPAERLPIALNNTLSDVYIRSAEEKPEKFHARFSALGKTYIYRFAVCGGPPIFIRNYASLLKEKPNTLKMKEGAKWLLGKNDFACFQAAGGAERETTVRTIFGVNIREGILNDFTGEAWETVDIEVTGDGFLYNMVRIIAGTLAEIGSGKKEPGDVRDMIESKDRTKAGYTAPPQGLYLKEVYFDKAALLSGAEEKA